jgi:acetyltransferase-like isoleucine patch superfamily enzyme
LIVDAVALVVVSPFALLYGALCIVARTRQEGTFQGFSQFFSLWPGLPGDYLRRAFYRLTIDSCAAECSIQFGTILATNQVRIRHGVYVGANCNIGHCTIGEDTLIGSNVSILSGNRQHHFERLDIPVRFQGGEYQSLSIGRDVWIGNGAIIMEDVGDHAIVAAGAVVVKPVEAYSIVGGNPGRVLGRRGATPPAGVQAATAGVPPR